MPCYRAPVNDGLFLLRDVLQVHTLGHLPGFSELTPEFCAELLHASARIHEDLLHPLNWAGDEEGARIEAGHVHTPSGFRQAWQTYRQAGWSSLSVPVALGGAGLPAVIATLVGEMRTATAHSFSMYGAFAGIAARMLSVLGLPWMHEHIVPRLVAGDWTATMCMTEPQAGTDLRLLRTRAVPQSDGSWRITGGKIFISGGDHDLTDNIVHIVLAKVADANGQWPEQLSAVHAFMVSKHMIDPQTGAVGGLNRVAATAIEHKMGIGGSATCAMDFEGAVGWRLSGGDGNQSSSNMAAMFLLMNAARMGTAVSGLAYAEIAQQNAADYARQRMAGRAPERAREPGQAADPLVAHPDVRRLLLGIRAFAEGGRAAAVRVALLQAQAEGEADATQRAAARELVELLQPVMKAYFTDKGFEGTNDALQVLGGHGYVREYGLEHFVRNARIGQLYEGANGIQALDLVQRRLQGGQGLGWQQWCRLVQAAIEGAQTHADLQPQALALAQALSTLERVVQEQGSKRPLDVAAGAYDLLTAIGITTVAWNWLEVGLVLQRPDVRDTLDVQFVQRKQTLAALWMQRELPLVGALCQRVAQGCAELMAVPDAWV